MMINQRLWLTRREVVTLKFPNYISSKGYCGSVYVSTDNTRLQLVENIERVYNSGIFKSISLYEYELLKQWVLTGLFYLSPLRITFVKRDDYVQYLIHILSIIPNVSFFPSDDPNYMTFIMPDKNDALVLIGLCHMMYCLTHGLDPSNVNNWCWFLNYENLYYENLEHMRNVIRLYRLDFKLPLINNYIPMSLFLDKVKLYVEEGSLCYNLIESFVNLPLIGDDGKSHPFKGMPQSGELSNVLNDLVLKEVFDREFIERFRGLAFVRNGCRVFIASRVGEVTFNEKALNALLKELNLEGDIVSIGPGDHPLNCHDNIWFFLDKDCIIRRMIM